MKKQHPPPFYFLLSYSYTPQPLYFTSVSATITFQSPKGQDFVFKELLFLWMHDNKRSLFLEIASFYEQNSTYQRLK